MFHRLHLVGTTNEDNPLSVKEHLLRHDGQSHYSFSGGINTNIDSIHVSIKTQEVSSSCFLIYS
jgi:cell wall assembly regulator SMI1